MEIVKPLEESGLLIRVVTKKVKNKVKTKKRVSWNFIGLFKC